MTQPELEIRRAWRHVIGPDHDGYVDDLLSRYREPHRYYHTVVHIMAIIRNLHDVAAMTELQPSAELVAAALYHDAIYDPRAGDNEALSAALASKDLAAIGWAAPRCAAVRALIEATAGHTAGDTAGDTVDRDLADRDLAAQRAILLDADLAILGAEPQSYSAYVIGVRAEYFFVDDDQWQLGRGQILRGFLERPRIFATEYMHDQLDHRARANIQAELTTLR